MGGNDLDFAKALGFCLRESRCQDEPYKGPIRSGKPSLRNRRPSLSKWVELAGPTAPVVTRLNECAV